MKTIRIVSNSLFVAFTLGRFAHGRRERSRRRGWGALWHVLEIMKKTGRVSIKQAFSGS